MASYILRKIDDRDWRKAKARSAKEGQPLSWIGRRLWHLYANGLVLDAVDPVAATSVDLTPRGNSEASESKS